MNKYDADGDVGDLEKDKDDDLLNDEDKKRLEDDEEIYMKLSCKTKTLERVKNKRVDEEIYMKTGKFQPGQPSNTPTRGGSCSCSCSCKMK